MDSDLGLDDATLRQLPFGHPMRRFFALDPDIAFLNNGSFGACPLPVLAAQDAIRREIERQPVAFFADAAPGRVRAAAARLAGVCSPNSRPVGSGAPAWRQRTLSSSPPAP